MRIQQMRFNSMNGDTSMNVSTIVRRSKRLYPVPSGCWYFVQEEKGGQSRSITNPEQAAVAAREHWERQPTTLQEKIFILTLDTKNKPISWHQVFIGTLDACIVHPREVFRVAIVDGAKSIILSHNHPSGDATPGEEDFRVTKRLSEAGKLLGIDVLDHIVYGDFCASIRTQRSDLFA